MLLSSTCCPRFASLNYSAFPKFVARTIPARPYKPPIVCRNSSDKSDEHISRTCPPTVYEDGSSYPTSAYLHLPFCRKRCYYCDFPVIALGTSGPALDDDPRIANYTKILCKEIESTPIYHEPRPLQTVFFGGGTPSLTPPKMLSAIIQTLSAKFGLSRDVEMSMEIDPGTFDSDSLQQFLELGVNRVSMGVQAFQDEALKLCGRSHGLREVYEAIDIVHASKMKNWSLDLISSLPHQTAEHWKQSLTEAIRANPAHISVYDLQIEQGTKFSNVYQAGEFPLPSEIKSAEFYRMARKMLTECGYDHYEISNYCKKDYECKHNLTYWMNRSYYGFGLGSTSYAGGVRFTRPRRMRKYVEFVDELADGKFDKGNDLGDADALMKERAMDIVMLSLRLARGLDIECFGREYGLNLARKICREFKPYVESEHVIPLDTERRVLDVNNFSTFCSSEDDESSDFGERNVGLLKFIRLSDPDGFLLSNELISTAFRVISP